MRKYILIFILFSTAKMFACDFCGCFMGITPYDNQSSISMMYRYKSYNGYYVPDQSHAVFPKSFSTDPAGNDHFANTGGNSYFLKHGGHSPVQRDAASIQRDYEIYRTAELRAKYFIHRRIELNGIVPFAVNKSRVNEEQEHVTGIGDITFFAGYHVISKTMTEKFQHRLILGAGVKLPVGDYYAKTEDGDRVDFLLQAGTGSTDYLVYLNYVFGFKKMGISFNSTYKLNGKNYYMEQIGNSTTNYLNIFYKFRQEKDLKIFPSIQGYYEYSKGEYINYVHQPATTMNVCTAGIGLDLFYKNFSLNSSFQLPIFEEQYKTNMGMAGKLMVALTYSFNQKKYLLNSNKKNE